MTSHEHLFFLGVTHHDGSQRRRTALEAILNSKTVNVWVTSVAVEAERTPGVRQQGDPTHMLRIADVLQANDSHLPSVLLEVPFVAAHLAHALLRRIGAATLAALAQSEVKAKEEASRTLAEDLLTAWLTRQVQELTLRVTPPATLSEAEREVSGVVELDQAAARLLQGTGKAGQAAWEKFSQRPRGKNPWVRWLRTTKEDPCSVSGLHALARVGWLDVVKPQLERERTKPAALPRLIHAPVTQILSGPRVVASGGRMSLDLGLPQPCIIREVAEIPNAAQNIKLFQSIHAHRVLWHIVFTAHSRAISNPGWSPHLEYEGGYAALAEACGIGGRDGAVKVRELIDLFSVLDLTLPGYQGGLLTRTFIEAKGQRRALLKIIPGTPLLPGYVFELQRVAGTASPAARRDQDLIPLLPVPPVMGRANDAGPQATLQLRVVAHLRDHAADLAEGRGAPLPLDTWAQLAEESHVPRSLAPKLLPHWQEDHQDGSAVLKRVDRDRYTLGDAHAAARAFLEEGGRRSLNSSEAGRRSTAKRAAARRKVGQK